MYHGITYPDEAYSEETRGRMTARFWYPVMKNGVIHFLPPEECPGQKPLREMPMKSFPPMRAILSVCGNLGRWSKWD